MKYLKQISIAFGMLMFIQSNFSNAAVYSELNDGAFSKDLANMTTLQFDPDSNLVSGAADNGLQYDPNFGYGADFFRFTLGEGETLTAINLINYTPFDASSFDDPSGFFGIGDLANGTPRNSNNIFGLDPGDENTSLINASLFTTDNLGPLGGPHYNLLNSDSRTDVDEAGDPLTFLQDFTGDLTLGPGSYWVWLSELTGSFTYELEFVIDSENVVATPIPASVFLLAGPLGFLMRFRKKISQ